MSFTPRDYELLAPRLTFSCMTKEVPLSVRDFWTGDLMSHEPLRQLCVIPRLKWRTTPFHWQTSGCRQMSDVKLRETVYELYINVVEILDILR